MPIEVRELIITAFVGSSEVKDQHSNTEQGNQHNEHAAQSGEHSDIVAECVEQVLEIIRKKIER